MPSPALRKRRRAIAGPTPTRASVYAQFRRNGESGGIQHLSGWCVAKGIKEWYTATHPARDVVLFNGGKMSKSKVFLVGDGEDSLLTLEETGYLTESVLQELLENYVSDSSL